MNTHYNLNLQTSAVPVVVNANQYDKGIRQYTFTVYNGDELADLTDVTAVTFDATKPDGYGLTYSGTITDGDIVITTTEQLTAVAGGVRATLRLWNADSDVIGSQRIVVNVERNGVDDDTIISDSDIPAIANAETYATTCQNLVNSIASESAQIQEIADNQCNIEDDTANNDVIITQYEQGSGSDVALVNTVNNNTTRIATVEGNIGGFSQKTAYSGNGIFNITVPADSNKYYAMLYGIKNAVPFMCVVSMDTSHTLAFSTDNTVTVSMPDTATLQVNLGSNYSYATMITRWNNLTIASAS